MMARSRILERKGRLEMGRKLSRLSGSRPGFFRRGEIVASLRVGGTVPELREVFMMLLMSGARVLRQAFKRGEGMGSRGQVVGFIVERSLVVSERDRTVKEDKV